MNPQLPEDDTEVNRLINQLVAKLTANRAVLEKSINHGRVKWRRGRKGNFDVDLELNL